MLDVGNKNIVLVVGKASTGKSSSLRNLGNQEGIAYLNTDLKEVPFKSKMQEVSIKDPMDIHNAISEIEDNSEFHMGVLDTLTFLMSNYETQYVLSSANTQKAWGDYGAFYKQFIHNIKSGTKNYAIMAHVQDIMNESEMAIETKAFVKGAVGKTGVEADFSIVIASRKVPIKTLKGIENSLLNITEEEEEDGFKYVFQTRVDKETMGWTMRSPLGLWSRNEKYIDNDLDAVFKRLNEYYA